MAGLQQEDGPLSTLPSSEGQGGERRSACRVGSCATAAKAVERLRVEAARGALDGGAASVQRVAADCGFGDPERMRRSVVRLCGMPPSALRRIGAASTAG